MAGMVAGGEGPVEENKEGARAHLPVVLGEEVVARSGLSACSGSRRRVCIGEGDAGRRSSEEVEGS